MSFRRSIIILGGLIFGLLLLVACGQLDPRVSPKLAPLVLQARCNDSGLTLRTHVRSLW